MVGGRVDRRVALVDAAFARIAAGGLAGLRLRQVAEDVGIDHSTLHHHVATKSDLIAEVVAHTLQRFRVTMPEQGDPAARLREHFARLEHLLSTDPALFVVTAELDLLAGRDPAVRAAVDRQEAGWRSGLVALFDEGLRSGAWTGAVDVMAAAELVIATVKGVRLTPHRAGLAFDQLRALIQEPSRTNTTRQQRGDR